MHIHVHTGANTRVHSALTLHSGKPLLGRMQDPWGAHNSHSPSWCCFLGTPVCMRRQSRSLLTAHRRRGLCSYILARVHMCVCGVTMHVRPVHCVHVRVGILLCVWGEAPEEGPHTQSWVRTGSAELQELTEKGLQKGLQEAPGVWPSSDSVGV